MIKATSGKLHWNYFLALERDLEGLSRYFEFAKPNFNVYSIELAHLLFAAASEVDVVAKLLCRILAPAKRLRNINDYRAILRPSLPDLNTTEVVVPRYGLTLIPWDNWSGKSNPVWWTSYNQVKHQRDTYFQEATLHNALNSLAALLIFTYTLYSYTLSPTAGQRLAPKDTTYALEPQSTLLRLSADYYYEAIIDG
ncbi:MAG TPA: hypothetical protein VH188_10155 [Chthoniobacterales bacterium]|jgi:hypothetical protein|nr:hypothetical protein [Chthoniobacterales bacterium]